MVADKAKDKPHDEGGRIEDHCAAIGRGHQHVLHLLILEALQSPQLFYGNLR